MEAGNLGAYLAGHPDDALDTAISILKDAPEAGEPDPNKPGQMAEELKKRREYIAKTLEVVARYRPEQARQNLAIPTWFYGNEPTNLFATHIAKYFSNSIREDGLLAIGINGEVYGPGGAGTRQEIFMDAAQNHYGTFQLCSPMVFLGTDKYGFMGPPPNPQNMPLFPVVQAYANKNYQDLLFVSDSPEEVVHFLEDTAHQPRPPI